MSASSQMDASATQSSELRQAQPRLNRKQNERMVTPPRPRAQVGSTQNGIGLLSCEKPDLRSCAAFVRDGQHPLDLCAMGWHLERRIPKERTNGGQSQVSAAGTNAALGLHVFKEGCNQRCIDLLQA